MPCPGSRKFPNFTANTEKQFMKKHIPNIITSLNLAAGVSSIFFVSRGEAELAAYLIFFAAAMDFLDGFSARLLNAYSDMGKQLDSLSDLVSFGIAPAFIAQHEILAAMGKDFGFSFSAMSPLEILLLMSPILLAVFTALRLAKFNIDDTQTESFIGLPSPASGLFFASIPLIREGLPAMGSILDKPMVLGLIVLFFSFLMVSNMPMFSLKIKDPRDKKHIPAYLLIAISIVLLILFSLKAVFFIVILYIFISPFGALFNTKKD